MKWEKCAMAIMCMPCRRKGANFVPTSQLVLASLDAERRHPVIDLAAGLRNGWADRLRSQGVERLIVIVDDLAVERSWMLPQGSARTGTLWPQVRHSMIRALDGTGLPFQVLPWSQVVNTASYETRVRELSQACLENGQRSEYPALRRAMKEEIARRLRFQRATGQLQEDAPLRRRAADQVANYAAQGELVHDWGVKTYLPWTEQEAGLMETQDSRFTQRLADFYYGGPGDSGAPWERLSARFAELVKTLRLYTDDLARAPGAVRPRLAAEVADAITDLLTPGTHERGLRRLSALNKIMPGGSRNHERVHRLLRQTRIVPIEPGWALEQLIKKLYCQLTSRYSNHEDEAEHARHREVLTVLAAQLEQGDGDHVALALTGSLPLAREGIWHPYFSDIDVMPLFATLPSPERMERIRAAYARTPRPPWLLLNEGARKGVAGLTHDPIRGLFVADRLDRLTAVEFDKLTRLIGTAHHVGGSAWVFSAFREAHGQQRKARRGELSVEG